MPASTSNRYYARAAFMLLGISLSACSAVSLQPEPAPVGQQPALTQTSTPTQAPSASPTAAPTSTPEPSPTETLTFTPEPSSTSTLIPTETLEPTPTLTPTYAFPQADILMQANCRYGPGTAYLYSHGLYTGDRAVVHGRNPSGTWLWIQPENLDRHCWAAASVMEVSGDVMAVRPNAHILPKTTFAGPPTGVQVSRSGDQVAVSWDGNSLSVDKFRGFLIEATICQNGSLVWVAVQTDNTFYTFTDSSNCSGDSSALLFTAEKHGYSDPVRVPWP